MASIKTAPALFAIERLEERILNISVVFAIESAAFLFGGVLLADIAMRACMKDSETCRIALKEHSVVLAIAICFVYAEVQAYYLLRDLIGALKGIEKSNIQQTIDILEECSTQNYACVLNLKPIIAPLRVVHSLPRREAPTSFFNRNQNTEENCYSLSVPATVR